MDSRVLSGLFAFLATASILADEPPAPAGATWKGSLSLGAELDERGLTKDDQAPPQEKPGRIRVGFSASWSFSLNWERVEAETDDGQFDAPELSPEEAKVIELSNTERKKLKLAALKPDPTLMKLARSHAAAMARLDQIGHDLEGKTFSKRLDDAKYRALRAGENVAQGHKTASEAVSGWMQSPGHKENIVQADYTRIGVGKATSKSGKTYWTQVFAKP